MQESSREKDNLERQMSALLDNPLVSSMLSDPKRLRGIMESHPQMKQVMKNNPEIASVLNDDRMMSKMSKYMANPALRRELMRNNDRALANIETIPGGWDALQYDPNVLRLCTCGNVTLQKDVSFHTSSSAESIH